MYGGIQRGYPVPRTAHDAGARMPHRTLRPLAATLAAFFLAAACEADVADGDGDDEPPVREIPASAEAAERLADAGKLVAADFPSGWAEAPTPGLADRDPPVWDDHVRASGDCEAVVESVRDDVVETDASNTFVDDDGSAVGNEVLVYEGELDAARAFARMESDTVADCFAQGVMDVVANRLEDDAEPGVGGVEVAPESRSPFEVGDEDVRIRVTASVAAATEGVLDLVAVREGPAVAMFVFDWAGSPDEELGGELVQRTVARMAAEVA